MCAGYFVAVSSFPIPKTTMIHYRQQSTCYVHDITFSIFSILKSITFYILLHNILHNLNALYTYIFSLNTFELAHFVLFFLYFTTKTFSFTGSGHDVLPPFLAFTTSSSRSTRRLSSGTHRY